MNQKQKKFTRFWGGIAGILLGGFMIFYWHNNWGFIPLTIGALDLTWIR